MTTIDLIRRAARLAAELRADVLDRAPLDDLDHPYHDLTGPLAEVCGAIADALAAAQGAESEDEEP